MLVATYIKKNVKASILSYSVDRFFLRKLFHRKEFYIIEILIVSYPSDVIVILISICLIEVTSIVVFCNLL